METYPYPTPEGIIDLVRKSEFDRLKWELDEAKAELACWHTELSKVMPPDFKDWHQNSTKEWPMVARAVIESLREREASAWDHAAGLT